ncbi:hypothetical protein D3C78_1480710 [compost metagenome]
MTKLDGNERWETKMIMNEHAKRLKEIENSSRILKRTFLMGGEAIQRRIVQDTYRLQNELKHRNIKNACG